MWPESLFRGQGYFDGIINNTAIKFIDDLLEQVMLATVNVTDRQIGLFQQLAILVDNRVGE